jgi:hypothetical protein
LNVEEKIDIITEVFKHVEKPAKVKADVLAFVKKHAKKANDLNIRSAMNLFPLIEDFGSDWERIAEYSFCG